MENDSMAKWLEEWTSRLPERDEEWTETLLRLYGLTDG